MDVQHINEVEFEELVLKAGKPVLVDFYADWCGPCQILAPIIEEVSDEVDGSALVYKLNVDEAPAIAAQYEVMSIPTLMVFKNGKIAATAVGYREKDEILKLLGLN